MFEAKLFRWEADIRKESSKEDLNNIEEDMCEHLFRNGFVEAADIKEATAKVVDLLMTDYVTPQEIGDFHIIQVRYKDWGSGVAEFHV